MPKLYSEDDVKPLMEALKKVKEHAAMTYVDTVVRQALTAVAVAPTVPDTRPSVDELTEFMDKWAFDESCVPMDDFSMHVVEAFARSIIALLPVQRTVTVEEIEEFTEQSEKTWAMSGANKLGPKSTFIAKRLAVLINGKEGA
jgi:hypothetical protein